jgi:hypothetical protein
MIKKICPKCKLELSEENFSKDKSNKNGLQSWCKDCNKKNLKNIEKDPTQRKKIRDRKRDYYKNNKNEINKRLKDYRDRNEEKFKEYRIEYYLENKEKIF